MKCAHYWKIAPDDGLTSHGVCIYCHEERDFLNWKDYDYTNERDKGNRHTLAVQTANSLTLEERP